jgi:hypothetical protein
MITICNYISKKSKVKSEWGADKNRMHGLFQFKIAGEAKCVYPTYNTLRKEAEALPVDVLSGEIGFPDVVRSLLRQRDGYTCEIFD